jgi:tetratricopeptide (TPR) repeat protein
MGKVGVIYKPIKNFIMNFALLIAVKTAIIFTSNLQYLTFYTMSNQQQDVYQHHTVYRELICNLLENPQEKETIIQSQADLIDEGLVMTLLVYAQQASEQNDTKTSDWLINLATELAENLKMELSDISPSIAEKESKKIISFLMSVFEAILRSRSNPQIIYPIFKANLRYLNADLIPIIRNLAFYLSELDNNEKKDMARVIGDFGNHIRDFQLGRRATNLEIAIASYETMLTAIDSTNMELFWSIKNCLGTVYRQRIRGDRAENLELSIGHLKAALEVYTRQNFPERWAMSQANLANAFENRIRGDRAENQELSIGYLKAALEVYTRQDFSADWEKAQNNLGGIYLNRIRGDRAENQELSIGHLTAALQVRNRQSCPEYWAITQTNLGVAYRDRIRGDKAENIKLSIECLNAALEVTTQQDFPIGWANIQLNLSNSYLVAGLTFDAIECLKAALEVRTRQAFPIDWAEIQSSLANAYVLTKINLSNAYLTIGSITNAINCHQFDDAITCYQAALEVFTPQLLPLQCQPFQREQTH